MTDFEYSIHRSARRRSICIQVRAAQVEVRAPIGVADAELHAFVAQKRSWIQAQLQRQQSQLAELPSYSFAEGCRLPYLGRELIVQLGRGGRSLVALRENELLVLLKNNSRVNDQEQTRRLVIGWYQRQALRLLEARTRALAARLGLVCTKVSIRETRSKWGHCTREGAIQYNWQIILAPDPIVDYLVAHEVCHLRHLNHSPEYWALVASVCPDYETRRAWLRAEGATLIL